MVVAMVPHDSDTNGLDAMLVLLPGSQITPQSIQLLTELTVFDAYMARSRLRTQLPVVLGPCCQRDLETHIGDRLERLSIRFIAIPRDFLDPPFHSLEVTACRLEPDVILLSDAQGQERIFPVSQPVLLLEGRYDIDKRPRKSPMRSESDRLMETVLNPEPTASLETGLRHVLFMYSRGDPHPVELLDSRLDYSFLGDDKALTTAENFRNLLARLSEAFDSPIVREMMHHQYALEQITENEADIESGVGRRARGKKPGQRRSNRSAIRLMSRLLYCQWMRERGWAGRVFPIRS